MSNLCKTDIYTKELLITRFNIQKEFVKGLKNLKDTYSIEFRLPVFPEDISENIIKFLIHYKVGDKTSNWACEKGDLFSKKEGVQECKCFTSDGPSSFSPSSKWDVLYFLDATGWLDEKFTLYKVSLKTDSPVWLSIKMSKKETFKDQIDKGKRPHIGWKDLYPQIANYTTKIYEGSFEGIFTEEVKEQVC